MNIETREVNISFQDPSNPNTYQDFTPFGWQQTQEARRGKSRVAILARDKDMPNYNRIAELDDQYFALKAKKKYYEKMSFSTFLLLLILFIVPGLLYWLFKYLQKKNVTERNNNIQQQMDTIANEARSLLKQ